MKRIKSLSTLLVLIVTLGFISCDTEPVDPVFLDYEPEVEEPASFQVDFSEQTYQATTTTVVMENGITTIAAVRASDGAVFTLVVPGTTAGTYSASVIAYAPGISGNQYTNMDGTNISGAVTFTAVNTTNNTISGTFSFTGYWSDASENLPSVEFTNGIFINLPFTSDTDPNPNPGNSSFSVDIDDETYIADNYAGTIGNGLISIGGTRGTSGEYVALVINATTVGTYSNEDLFFGYSSDGDEDNVYSNIDFGGGENDAQLTITQIDEANQTISGTFSFTGYLGGNSKSFTNGQFTNIPYTTGQGTDESEFMATVDGVAVDYIDDLLVGTVNNQVTIAGVGADHEINLFIGTLGVGVYSIPGDNFSAPTASYTDDNDVEYNAVSGTLTITEKAGGWVSGTFEYTVQDEAGNNVHTVTNGTFNVEY
ncbi:hypothetical protein E0W72_12025 [Flavobacterium arcticum]|nr:DUF6252 family protein [Flavobacterium arcticum]KAF2507597.1 hypothetical protein E0W72_12025 [Flavobacterium arcticum]